MRVLVACEFSGIVRDAFIERGHDAVSCDLLPTERPGPHHQGSIFELLHHYDPTYFDLMIAHPPCTYLAVSGARWMASRPQETAEALEFVRQLLNAPIPQARVHRMPPGPDRWKERSRTLPGIAAAMAEQWGSLAAIESAA